MMRVKQGSQVKLKVKPGQNLVVLGLNVVESGDNSVECGLRENLVDDGLMCRGVMATLDLTEWVGDTRLAC